MWSSEKEGNFYTQRAKLAEKFCHRRLHVSTPGYYVGVSYGSALLNGEHAVECGHTSQTASYYDWGNLCHMVATNNACSNTGRYKFSKYELQKPTYFENTPQGADNFESCRTFPT